MNKRLSDAITSGQQDREDLRLLEQARRAREEEVQRKKIEAVVEQYRVWLDGCDFLYDRVRRAVSQNVHHFNLFLTDLPDPSLPHLPHLAVAIQRIEGFHAHYEPDDSPGEGGDAVHSSVQVTWSYLT